MVREDNFRIDRETMFMQITEVVAKRSTCLRARVGATIIRDNRVVSIGYAGAPSRLKHCTENGCKIEDGHCVRTVHAEANAIAFAAKAGIPTDGAEMYITHSPCKNCAKLIINSGIRRVTYREYRGDGIELLDYAGVEVIRFDRDSRLPSQQKRDSQQGIHLY